MVVFPIIRLVAFANERTMLMIGKSSLHQSEKAMILASIINRDRAVSVCNLNCYDIEHSAKVDDESIATLFTSESV